MREIQQQSAKFGVRSAKVTDENYRAVVEVNIQMETSRIMRARAALDFSNGAQQANKDNDFISTGCRALTSSTRH